MLITLDYFNRVTGDYNSELDQYKTDAIKASQEIIEAYLGFLIEPKNYDMTIISYSRRQVKLPAPAISILSIEGTNATYYTNYNYIHFSDDVYGLTLRIQFTGGLNPVPSIILLACVEIASLKLAEKGLNVAFSGLQMPDGMGYQRYNYTNYEKFLKPLEHYRIR
ncbi:TPA: hypothetical protein ENX78_08600 [Candidatus Poribacteria bacterium]|nr:hypothetical protein [Candidatus Poribacteria bacterium]